MKAFASLGRRRGRGWVGKGERNKGCRVVENEMEYKWEEWADGKRGMREVVWERNKRYRRK